MRHFGQRKALVDLALDLVGCRGIAGLLNAVDAMLAVDQPVDVFDAADNRKAEAVDVEITRDLVSLGLPERPLSLTGRRDTQRVEADLFNLRPAWTRIHLQSPDEAGV